KGPTNYDTIIRVPLIVRGPDVANGRTVSGLVEHVDVAPALLEASGVPTYAGMKGRSLLPLAQGRTDTARESVLVEFRDVTNGVSVKTVRSTDFKYTSSRRAGTTEEALFDLRRDPDEFDEVAQRPDYAPA